MIKRKLNFHFVFNCFQSSIIWQTNYTQQVFKDDIDKDNTSINCPCSQLNFLNLRE